MKKILIGFVSVIVVIFIFVKISSDGLPGSLINSFCDYTESEYGYTVKDLELEEGFHHGSMDLTYYVVTGLVDGGEYDDQYVLALITEPGKSYGNYYDTSYKIWGYFDTRDDAQDYYYSNPNLS
ncbi:MAG: hypothetical protein IJK60_03460 [Clostridia bacterium]|nr:hypothetical protein [Clostridia bacterium]